MSRRARRPADRLLADIVRSGRALDDPRAVHRVRVALERLRVWALLGDVPGVRKTLRWARDHAAGLRDVDVCLALGPPPAVAAKLRHDRPALQRRVERALASPRFESAVHALRVARPPSPSSAARRAAKLAQRALARTNAAHHEGWTAKSVHRLRRSLRRTRYAFECLGAPCAELVALQRGLGAVSDRRMAIHRLRRGGTDQRRFRGRLGSELALVLEASRGRRKQIRAALKSGRRRVMRGARKEER